MKKPQSHPRRKVAYFRRPKKAALPPGSPGRVGEQAAEKVKISVISYDEAGCKEQVVADPVELGAFRDAKGVTWINVAGLCQPQVIEKIGEIFKLHTLVTDDILNTSHRPKAEDLDDRVFIVFRALDFDEKTNDIWSEQVSLIFGFNFLISFQERETNLFNGIKDRIRMGKGRLRKSGPDYLAYALLDAMVDNDFMILEKLGDQIETLEEELVTRPDRDTLKAIHGLKTHMIYMRQSVWPLREVINGLLYGELRLIDKSTVPFLRDLYDHTIHAIDIMETFRDIISGMLDIYLSSVSYRLNEIMKVLTIIATIFIPLTFLSGWYGMNFKTMPELDWKYGYVMVICVAISIVVTMLVYFKRKRWL
jgi:magnesium transporter